MKINSMGSFFLGVFITFLATGLALVLGIYLQDSAYKNKIYPSIYIDGIPQSGKTLKEAKAEYQELNKQLKNLDFEVLFENTHVATISGEMISLRTNGENIAENAYLITRTGTDLNKLKERLQALTETKKFSFTSNLEYTTEPLTDIIELLKKQYNVAPKNALFEIKNGKVSAFTLEKNGVKVNSEEAIADFRKNLSKISSSKKTNPSEPIHIKITKSIIKPDVTLAEANKMGIQEVIGVGTSDYSGSIPERVHNLLLATSKIHGTIVPKDGTFSYNKTVGDISALTGYKPAYVIVNGRTVLGDGGGVCQTSTTLFRATLNSGLPITEWHAHAYRVHYYENDGKPGIDATVYAPSVDFQFKNDTGNTILIQTEADTENNLLKYTFWGKKDGRKIAISDVSMGNAVPAPPPRDEEDPTLKKGVRKQVDWAANGLTTWFDYRVTKGNEVIQEKRFTSYYKPWQAVFLVGTAD